ncbi:MAG TPA: rhodanese-like domain-containing protein [Burkholderiales bacterium]|nr:rhodanese-like domain-containing protein [Burkholderiales bacterium]
MASARRISAAALRTMLGDGAELALLDVREEGVFARGHLLFAASLPLSQLELRADALVPRRSTRSVLIDENDGLAARAAERLAHFGYTDVAVLDGGMAAWAAQGYPVYSGVNVPSKAFGEFIEQRYHTPHIDAAELKSRLDAGERIVVLDSRPLPEYRRMSIPGATDCPGAELAYRVHDLVDSPDTLVVVNCAGRTRSIIGAQSLINAGIPNRVMALKNGTMGWHLAGLELAHGAEHVAAPPGKAGLAKAKRAAARVARRFGVKSIDVDTVRRFAGEMDWRSLYLLDVRSPEEFEAGHLACTVNAPGGQLVQATDAYVGTRNARILLIDDHGVRATLTASWLIQMGWSEVYVVENALRSGPLYTGPAPVSVLGLDAARAQSISAGELQHALDGGQTAVIDIDTSLRYRDGHVPGAWFAVRSRFATDLARLPPVRSLTLTSADGVLARLAAAEAAAATGLPVQVLDGGTRAWRAAGLPLAHGPERLASGTDDVSYKAYDHAAGVEQRMQEYLDWETALVEQIARDGDVRFRTFPA